MAIHSDMQGPCPDGFHVPTSTELSNIVNAGVSLGAWATSGTGNNIGEYLKLAYNAKYISDDGTTTSSGINIWSCNISSTSAIYLRVYSNSIYPNNTTRISRGYSIRPFKNTSVIPTSSWTKLYGTSIESGGIFWSETDGLISISSNGTDWITIADKNLGATTVYNTGDTLSENNCGKLYQRGNNYGFPYLGPTTTSSTQADASNYGPGNYYSSSTFITRSNSPRNWSSVQNDNLWGGVTQGTWYDPIKLHGHIGTWHMIHIDDDYSAIQGPAPSGFHVPLNTEWQAVYNIRTALGGGSSDGTNFGIALKLPFAGRRSRSSSNIGGQGDSGNYWSSLRKDSNNAYYFYFISILINPGNDYRAMGYSVRCFKDSPVIPTSSWTKLYGTSIEAGGIFWSSTDGLISLSSDGQTWITIADKNLGATTVWNNGDTLSEANCGKYYQRGNNYGFPFDGSVTTSSTQVDASNYGPGNYYSSSTFIIRDSFPFRWDTTDNGNLRGGVTGVIPGYYQRK